jgi:hypothetical protein
MEILYAIGIAFDRKNNWHNFTGDPGGAISTDRTGSFCAVSLPDQRIPEGRGGRAGTRAP